MVIAAVLMAAWLVSEPDPITDHLRYEIAAAQRDYLIARQQYEAAAVQLKEKLDMAAKACAAQEATFDLAKFACQKAEKK